MELQRFAADAPLADQLAAVATDGAVIIEKLYPADVISRMRDAAEERAESVESIDRLAKLYLDADVYPMRAEGEERSLFTLTPTKVVTFGAP